MYLNSLSSIAIDIAINFITSKFPLLTRVKIITHVSNSWFMYLCRSQSLLSKVVESLHGGKEELHLREKRGYCAWQHQSTGWEFLLGFKK
jgi:hypothetical protein